ncbi:hypothetical protein [Pilimelia columellifera]|uniref:Uncharacterized protein n=1 Tax=Pilimelia columellifera subsp. columellifera TaxID=706583 RepID=A0ABN3NJ74_9ACTN
MDGARGRVGRRAGAAAVVAALALVAADAPLARSGAPSRIVGVGALPADVGGESWAARPVESNGLRMVASSGPDGFSLHTASGPQRFLPGVNLGSTTPGTEPGQLAMTADDYRAWFDAMRRLGVRVVRVYTIHPPAFYTELAAHNDRRPHAPLYLAQGVYLPDEHGYVTTGNLFEPAHTTAFVNELRDASAAVSGALARAPTPGRASGRWTTDVSRWLALWIVGVEWDPVATAASDRRNARAAAHRGRYFVSGNGATPTERWLAARMDDLATAEVGRGRSAPMAFVNWPTTDPLRHPEEPNPREDVVGIDANRVLPTQAWPGGTFASYHAYPYYPDFQRHLPAASLLRYRGQLDPYVTYLAALRSHHGAIPVMITEFGVPSSVGSAHLGPLGRHQGGHAEDAAMAIDAELLHAIKDQGLAGGMVFAWADEWFKFTWNTINRQAPAHRRALWHDALTNEQHFGVIATDPLGPADVGWHTLWEGPAGQVARRVEATFDEAQVQLRITLDTPRPPTLTIGLDTLPTVSGPPPPGGASRGADIAVAVDLTGRDAQVWTRQELDPVQLDYRGDASGRLPAVGGWRPYELVLNRAVVVPTTGESLPAEYLNVGRLRHGSWGPGAGADSRALWRLDGGTLTMRLPWALAGFADPSSLQVLTPSWGVGATAPTEGIRFSVDSVGGGVADAGVLRWEPWQRVRHRERLKPSAGLLRDAMVAVAAD